jgi:hypothetical protein
VLQSKPESAIKPEQGKAPVAASARAAVAAANSMADAAYAPLEMKAPSPRHQRQGLPAVVRTLMAVVLAGLLVWAAGKAMGLWSK